MNKLLIGFLFSLFYTTTAYADSLRVEFEKHNFSQSNYKTVAFLSKMKYPTALAIHGSFYILGEFVEKDVKRGIKMVEQSAGLGNKYAIYGLGKIYAEGIHVKQDHVKALNYFLKVENSNNKEVNYELGKMYALGLGTKKDIEKGKRYLLKSAEQGNKQAEDLLNKF